MGVNVLSSECISFRWINCQCFEIKLPNGKTVITDPCYHYPENASHPIADLFRLNGFETGDLEACDYVILNHTHGDHMCNLEAVVDRFQPTIVCHSGVAVEIAETCENLPLTSVYPVDYDGTYYFEGFRMDTFHGSHKPQPTTWRRSMEEGDCISQKQKLSRLHTIGSFFNMNYLITLDNGFRIAFVGGLDDGMKEHLRRIRPNIVLRNKTQNDMSVEAVAKDWLGFMEESHAQYVLPMHYEVWENQKPGFSKESFQRANELAQEQGLGCRIVPLERTKWYTMQLCLMSR